MIHQHKGRLASSRLLMHRKIDRRATESTVDSHENELWDSLIQEPLLEQDKKYYVVLLRSNFVGCRDYFNRDRSSDNDNHGNENVRKQ